MKPERFVSGRELRAEGRTLTGPAIVYGETSPSHRERFEAGAFNLADGLTRWLDIGHDRSRVLAHTDGGGLELRDGDEKLEVRATLPKIPVADGALEAVRAGKLQGFSVDFKALRERKVNGIRVIESARLNGVGLVRFPSYPGSRAEVRARSGFTMSSYIPAGRAMDCECSGAACTLAEFTGEALQSIVDEGLEAIAAGNIDELLAEARVERRRGDIIAAWGSYANPLASLSKGTLRLSMRNGRLEIEMDLPDSDAGRAVMAANEDAGVVVRPFLDSRLSEGEAVTVSEGINKMVYTKAAARAFIVSSTDARAGWPSPEITDTRARRTPNIARWRRWQ